MLFNLFYIFFLIFHPDADPIIKSTKNISTTIDPASIIGLPWANCVNLLKIYPISSNSPFFLTSNLYIVWSLVSCLTFNKLISFYYLFVNVWP